MILGHLILEEFTSIGRIVTHDNGTTCIFPGYIRPAPTSKSVKVRFEIVSGEKVDYPIVEPFDVPAFTP